MRKGSLVTSATLSSLGLLKLLIDGLSGVDTIRMHLPWYLQPYASTSTVALLCVFAGYVVLLLEIKNPSHRPEVIVSLQTSGFEKFEPLRIRNESAGRSAQEVFLSPIRNGVSVATFGVPFELEPGKDAAVNAQYRGRQHARSQA
jgi:hypothetical protein